jgi:MFS family permease
MTPDEDATIGPITTAAGMPVVRAAGETTAFAPWMVSLVQHRNFRLLWIGQLISLSGSTMQMAAILWHVSMLVPAEDRGLTLGVVGLVRVGPIAVFSLVSGVAADALDRRRLMMVVETVLAIISGTLALLTLRGAITVWTIYALDALSAAVATFDAPARQALIPAVVPRAHLSNAISLNQIMLEIAYVSGPSLGGMVIASAGPGWAYAFNAVSSLGALGALTMMRDVPVAAAGGRSDVSLRSAVEGLRFVFASAIIRSTMLVDFLASFFGATTVLLPIFAQDILRVGAGGYGWLSAAPAVGAMLASAVMVRLVDRVERRGRLLLWSIAAYGVATILFGFSRSFWLTFACLAAAGAADTVGSVLRRIIRQLETPDRLRGRMTGVNMMFFIGGPELGRAEAGVVAQWWTAPISVITGGLATVVAAVWIARAAPVLREYRQDLRSRARQEAR